MWTRDPTAPILSEEEFRLLRDAVHAHCGLWYRDENRYLLERRLLPRLQALGLQDFASYHRYLRFDPGREAELDDSVELLTTNETYFYREPYQLEAFAREILPALATVRSAERRLRILSAGCSTGEEAYTIAALVRESGRFDDWDVEVLGLDLSRRCVAQARAGAYGEPELSLSGCSLGVVDESLRAMVRFQRENLVSERALSTASRVDVVFCRNVMIYFDLAARRRLLRRFHEKMRDGAWLLLGHSESLINITADFELVHLTSDLVYRKPGGAALEGA